MASTTEPITLRASDDETLQALQAAVGVLAAKWSVVVLARLAEGTHRFNELLRQIDGVSRRMLSATLRQLERDGLVERHVYARVPARVEYELSPVGEHLLVALVPLAGWGLEHQRRRLERARALRPPAALAVGGRGDQGAFAG